MAISCQILGTPAVNSNMRSTVAQVSIYLIWVDRKDKGIKWLLIEWTKVRQGHEIKIPCIDFSRNI